MYRGINYLGISLRTKYIKSADSAAESNLLAGKALTAFTNGQCLARSARNHPTAFDLA